MITLPLKAAGGARASLAVAQPVIAAPRVSLFTTQAPAQVNLTDNTAYELGTKFRASVAGKIVGLRFYKGSQEGNGHVGKIYSATGTLLASVNFVGETASGWQQQLLPTPLDIAANTTYVVSVNTVAPSHRYVATTNGLAAQITNGALSSVVGSNGVYGSPGSMPASSYQNSNYFRDVLFESGPVVADTVAPSAPTGLTATAVSSNQINLAWTASMDNVGVAGYRVLRGGLLVGSPTGTTFSDTGLLASTAYGYVVQAADAAGNVSASSNTASATTTEATPGTAADGIPAGWPNSTNTGYRNAPGYPGALTAGPSSIQSNTTYSFRDFSGGLFVGSNANPVTNVVFYGCRFRASGDANVVLFGGNISFDYCSFEPAGASAPPVSYAQGYQYGISANGSYYSRVGSLTVTHCDIWGFGNAIDHGGSTQANPHVFRDNWIHDARADGGIDHTDGIGELSGGSSNAYVVIDHNSIVSVGNTQGIAYQGKAGYHNFTVTNNYVSGWGFTVAIGNSGGSSKNSNITFTDNVFGTNIRCGWGPLYDWGGTGNTWRRNKIHFVPGTNWTSGNGWTPVASDDGKFWTPSGVSATDYTG